MDQQLRTRLAAGGILTLMFVAGLAIGFAWDRESGGPQAANGADVRRGTQRPEPPSGWIIDRLDLEPVRRAKIDSVVDYYGARMSALQREYRPQYRAVVDSTNLAIRDLLTSDQRARYDSLQAGVERWREREREQGSR